MRMPDAVPHAVYREIDMLRKSRKKILEEFRRRISEGKILVGIGTGMDDIAKRCDKLGVDLLVLYHTGRLHMAGRSSVSGILSYDDANTIVREMGEEILPSIKKTPLLAGVCGTDPFRIMRDFLGDLKEQGFFGVQNFPSVGVVDGKFRANLEDTNMGYQMEVDMIRTAHEMDLFTCAYVFDAEQAEAMTQAGADALIIHLGLVTKASMRNGTALTIEDCCRKTRVILDKSKAVRQNIMVFCYGRQIADPEDAAHLLRDVPELDGLFSVFPVKPDESERNLTARIRGYKSLDHVKSTVEEM